MTRLYSPTTISSGLGSRLDLPPPQVRHHHSVQGSVRRGGVISPPFAPTMTNHSRAWHVVRTRLCRGLDALSPSRACRAARVFDHECGLRSGTGSTARVRPIRTVWGHRTTIRIYWGRRRYLGNPDGTAGRLYRDQLVCRRQRWSTFACSPAGRRRRRRRQWW